MTAGPVVRVAEYTACAPSNPPAVLECSFCQSTAVDPDLGADGQIQILGWPYPNPPSGLTELSFRLRQAGDVDLQVFDIAGRAVRELPQGRLESGWHELRWDGRDSAGEELTAGTYISVLLLDGQVVGSRKIVILR